MNHEGVPSRGSGGPTCGFNFGVLESTEVKGALLSGYMADAIEFQLNIHKVDQCL